MAFRLYIQATLFHGVPFSDVLGVVRFIDTYAGYLAAADALECLGGIGAELGVDVRVAAAEEASTGRQTISPNACGPGQVWTQPPSG